jgi:hypothetical protein
MNEKMFANREHLEQSDLDSYAKDVGMDVSKFHKDMQSDATNDRLARDKKLGDSLDVKGTPTIYINGRDYDPRSDLGDWISLELGAGSPPPAPPPAPAPSSSGSKPFAAVPLDAGPRK